MMTGKREQERLRAVRDFVAVTCEHTDSQKWAIHVFVALLLRPRCCRSPTRRAKECCALPFPMSLCWHRP